MRRVKDILFRVGLLAIGVVAPAGAWAQTDAADEPSGRDGAWPAFDLALQAGALPIQLSDGGRAGIAGPLWSGRLAYRPPLRGRAAPRRLALELSAGRAPGGGSGEVLDPAVEMLSVSLRESVRAAGGADRVDPFVSAGVTWLRVSPQLGPATCLPPACMREGGKDWQEGEFTLLTVGFGVIVPLPAQLRAAGLRTDGRLHLPLAGSDDAGDSAGTWVELSAGLRLAF